MSENKTVDFNAIKAEKEEIRLLINNGISFIVHYKEKDIKYDLRYNKLFKKIFKDKDKAVKIFGLVVKPRTKNILGLLFKRKTFVEVERSKEFIIKQPTLFTLDRLSLEYIELKIDETKIQENPRGQSRLYFLEYGYRMARIIAIAILGNDWEDEKKLNELTAFLFRWLNNSTLIELIGIIDLTNNLADFINSIRLISSARTTIPNLIENKQE